MILGFWELFFKNYFLPPTITGGVPASEPGNPGTTCVLPSHLSRNNLKSTWSSRLLFNVSYLIASCSAISTSVFALSNCWPAICFCSIAALYSSAISNPVRSKLLTST